MENINYRFDIRGSLLDDCVRIYLDKNHVFGQALLTGSLTLCLLCLKKEIERVPFAPRQQLLAMASSRHKEAALHSEKK